MDISFDRQKLNEFCKKHNLKLLILHGSYAKGTATSKSDIDVGILSQEKIDSDKYFEILKDFGEIFGDKFDPVFLNGAEPLISYQVALAGKPLFEKIKGSFADFRVQSMGRYLDTKKFRELEKHYLEKAIGRK